MSRNRSQYIVLRLVILAIILLSMAACEEEYVMPTEEVVGPSSDERVVDIVETKPERFEVIDVSKIPARNCVGPNPLRFRESLSKSTSEEVTVGASVSAGIVSTVMVAIEAEYHVTRGHRIEKTVEIEVEARPGTHLEYQIVWKEVWTDGYVIVEMSDGSQRQVEYSVRHSLQGEVLDPTDIGCR